MNDLATLLNNDIVYYIKECTVEEIKKDALALYDYFINKSQNAPIEPLSGKQYNVWVQYMLYYTKTVKPIEDQFRNLYTKISESQNFETLQELYPKLKDTFDKWYSLKKKAQYSGNYNYT